nr:MAG TPA: hypothetical protein [Caudoviricetes sp.]
MYTRYFFAKYYGEVKFSLIYGETPICKDNAHQD